MEQLEYEDNVSNLEILLYNPSLKESENEECILCNKVNNKYDCYQLPCKHYGHTRCIRKWIDTEDKIICKVCKDETPNLMYCMFCKEWKSYNKERFHIACDECKETISDNESENDNTIIEECIELNKSFDEYMDKTNNCDREDDICIICDDFCTENISYSNRYHGIQGCLGENKEDNIYVIHMCDECMEEYEDNIVSNNVIYFRDERFKIDTIFRMND